MLCMGTYTCCSGAASGPSQLVIGAGQAVSAAVCRHASGREAGSSCRQGRRGRKDGNTLFRLSAKQWSADKPHKHTLSGQSNAWSGYQVQKVGWAAAETGVSLSAAPGPLPRRNERPTITAGASRDHSGIALDAVILVVARDTPAGLVVVVTVGHRQASSTVQAFFGFQTGGDRGTMRWLPGRGTC